jgi:hypothetical protein
VSLNDVLDVDVHVDGARQRREAVAPAVVRGDAGLDAEFAHPLRQPIDIDEFVPKDDIDPRYLIRPYYLVPFGKVGHGAFAVIRETIRNMNMAAIRRVVFATL